MEYIVVIASSVTCFRSQEGTGLL